MAARHEEGCYEKIQSLHILLFVKDCRTMTSGGQGAPYFMIYGRELVSKLAISLKKSWGGYVRTTRDDIETWERRRLRHKEYHPESLVLVELDPLTVRGLQ